MAEIDIIDEVAEAIVASMFETASPEFYSTTDDQTGVIAVHLPPFGVSMIGTHSNLGITMSHSAVIVSNVTNQDSSHLHISVDTDGIKVEVHDKDENTVNSFVI